MSFWLVGADRMLRKCAATGLLINFYCVLVIRIEFLDDSHCFLLFFIVFVLFCPNFY